MQVNIWKIFLKIQTNDFVSRRAMSNEMPNPQGAVRLITYNASNCMTTVLLYTGTQTAQLGEHNNCLNYLLESVEGSQDLKSIAFNLKWAFISLVEKVKESLEQKIDLDKAKMRITISLTNDFRGLPENIARELDFTRDFNSFFKFLTKHRFIGYLNYVLLKKIAEPTNDKFINDQFATYEEQYVELLSTGSFREIMSVFKEHPHLSSSAPIGLPQVVFRLERPWLIRRVYDWIITSLNVFSAGWSKAVLLGELRENCILITYAILPSSLSDVLRDLTNPLILEQLEANEVTVISLPEEAEQIAADAPKVAGSITSVITETETSSRILVSPSLLYQKATEVPLCEKKSTSLIDISQPLKELSHSISGLREALSSDSLDNELDNQDRERLTENLIEIVQLLQPTPVGSEPVRRRSKPARRNSELTRRHSIGSSLEKEWQKIMDLPPLDEYGPSSMEKGSIESMLSVNDELMVDSESETTPSHADHAQRRHSIGSSVEKKWQKIMDLPLEHGPSLMEKKSIESIISDSESEKPI